MENFNRILSFIIGLVVVVVIVAVIANRINLGKRVSTLSQSLKKVSPTPTKVSDKDLEIPYQSSSPTPSPTPKIVVSNKTSDGTYETKGGLTNQPKKIPSTGAPTLLIPLSLAGAFIGGKLKNSGRK